jgi:hypothetical protein
MAHACERAGNGRQRLPAAGLLQPILTPARSKTAANTTRVNGTTLRDLLHNASRTAVANMGWAGARWLGKKRPTPPVLICHEQLSAQQLQGPHRELHVRLSALLRNLSRQGVPRLPLRRPK